MMIGVKTKGTKVGQRILVSRGGIFAIKPRLVPILGVAWQAGIREDSVSSALNRDSTKFQARAVREFILVVQIKIFPKEVDAGLLLKVYFAEDLEVADI